MNIEEYASLSPQFYNYEVPPLLKKYLSLKNYITFLDCGCGDGAMLYALKKEGYFKKIKTVAALDLSKSRVALVKKLHPNIHTYVDSAEEMSTIKSNSVDFFISTQVIEHVDDKKMPDSIYRVTKKNGIVYISTVFKKWYGWYFYRNLGKWVLDPTHLREYGKDRELLKHFSSKKFKLLENKKTLQWFPLVHFFLKRINIKKRKLADNVIASTLSKIKIPIFGYYNWELVFKKL